MYVVGNFPYNMASRFAASRDVQPLSSAKAVKWHWNHAQDVAPSGSSGFTSPVPVLPFPTAACLVRASTAPGRGTGFGCNVPFPCLVEPMQSLPVSLAAQ